MDVLIHEFTLRARDGDGHLYRVRALARERDDGTWVGWLEFTPHGGGIVRRSPRETSQPSRPAVVYWALGLDEVYLDGALERALREPVSPTVRRELS